ncbi:hypothetical protein AAGS40_24985 (plasmid) [Paraburkholderia sp. PREW-6R]|uniref:hypothetical protein n=1 Tax=Paraburkholderia sp. PREW-6R TaxID=3141544 RepID=UPI0031F54A2B
MSDEKLKASRSNIVVFAVAVARRCRARLAQPTPGFTSMQIVRFVSGLAALAAMSTVYAEGFVVTQSMSNGREMRLLEHAPECDGGPGAFVYRRGKQIEQTCHVSVTPGGATIILPAYEPRVFIPRDTLDQNSKS